MRIGSKSLLAVVTGLTLVMAGCADTKTGDASGAPTSAGGGATSAASGGGDQGARDEFAGKVCGAVAKFVEPSKNFKPDTSSPAAALTSIKTQLQAMSTGLGDANKDLDAIDTSKVPEGKEAVTNLKSTFGQVKSTVDGATGKLSAVNASDPQAVAAALKQVGTDLTALSKMENPLDSPGMQSKEMEAAAKNAPACVALEKNMKGGASTPPTS